jgi:hypothetical protein
MIYFEYSRATPSPVKQFRMMPEPIHFFALSLESVGQGLTRKIV